MPLTFGRLLIFPLLLAVGLLFSYRLILVPSRMETAVFIIVAFTVPTLKYPKFGVYYLFCMPLLIPLFRRMYYLVAERPALDYLMLISDGVMGGFIVSLLLLWIINKERSRDPLSYLVLIYTALLFIKIFLGNIGSTIEGFYGFKFNGLYVMFFFAGSYVLTRPEQIRRVLGFSSWVLLFTGVYGVKQILFGFTSFEQKWLDSITFTTLRIEGVVRPFSTYVSPAAMADGMVILFTLGIFWLVSRGRHTALFGLLLCGAAVPPLLIATVRTNWLAAMAGVFFFLIFLRIRKTWVRRTVLVALLVGGALFAAKGENGADTQNAAMSNQLSRKDKSLSEIMIKNRTRALANPLQEYSVQKRMEIWGTIWYFALRNPLGRGQGTAGYAHSYYFQILGEIGFPGLFAFLGILVLAFRRGFQAMNLARDRATAETARLLLTLLFMFSILNLTGTHLHTTPGDIFFWFSAGALSRLHRNAVAETAAAAAAAGTANGETGVAEAEHEGTPAIDSLPPGIGGLAPEACVPKRLAVIGHPLAAEENRMAFRGWKGFQVDLIAPRTWKARSLGHVYRSAEGGRAPGMTSLHSLPTLASGRNSLFLWVGLGALLRRLRPDLIYCWEEPWCLSAWQVSRLARALRIPLVFYSAENRPKPLPWPFGAVMRAVFRSARACVAPTAEIARTIRAAGFAGEVLPVPLWIRPRRQVEARAANRELAYLGRLIALKRVHLLVEALRLLPGCRLKIIGDGPEMESLRALADGLGLSQRVAFCGHVDNGELEAYLDGASLLVLPTGENARQAEQFGKAALEGVSCGLPVLASRTGNLALLAEEIPTVAARDLDSPAQMAEAVAALLADYPPPAALGESRRRVLDQYGPAAAARMLEAAFTPLAAGGAP